MHACIHMDGACIRRPRTLDAAIAACLPVRQANLKALGYGW